MTLTVRKIRGKPYGRAAVSLRTPLVVWRERGACSAVLSLGLSARATLT